MSTNVSNVTNHFPSAQDGFTTTTAGTTLSGATTVVLNSVTGYTNGQTVVLIIEPTSTTAKQAFTGVVDTAGVQITGVKWTSGTNQTHAAGVTVVDYETATHWSMIAKGLEVEHKQAGTHSDVTADSVTTNTLEDSNGPWMPVGSILDYAGASAPGGWLLCYGQAISRTTYSALFTAISTTYGVGDGSSTFNLPDLRGRVVAGQDDMGGSSANRLTNPGSTINGIDGDVLGATGGAETHQLTVAQLAAHHHSLLWNPTVGGIAAGGVIGQNSSNITDDTGGDAAHNNVQPTIILNKIIKF